MHEYTAKADLPFQDICYENRAPAGWGSWVEGRGYFNGQLCLVVVIF